MKKYMGVDNGSSGHYTVMMADGEIVEHARMPRRIDGVTIGRNVSRLDYEKFKEILVRVKPDMVVMERCALIRLNPNTSLDARAFQEAAMISLEQTETPYEVIPASDWQDRLFPKHKRKRTAKETKPLAAEMCARLFPKLKTKEPDSVLMVEWLRRRQGGV